MTIPFYAVPGLPPRPPSAWLGAFSGGLPGSQTLDFALATRLALEDLRSRGGGVSGGPSTGGLPLMVVDQVHSADIFVWDGAPWPTGRPLPKADGILVPPRPDAQGPWRPVPGLVATRTADCVPILAWGVESGAYAAVHAGWRGAALGILPNLVKAWRGAGLDVAELRLALGPSIQACCFEMGPDALGQFDPALLAGNVTPAAGGKAMLDLHGVLAAQAADLGLGAHQVARVAHCTRCYAPAGTAHPLASHRRHLATGEPRRFNTSFIGRLG